jgi:uncharacterized YigZ family protein
VLSGDTYKTIKSASHGLFKDRGSRFIAIAEPVTDQARIRELLEQYKKEYHDARHHCYAYVLGFDKNSWRANDDGEPSGTAGKPILGQINYYDLTNVIIVVIRYFGGTLLGTSGLINAYRSAAYDAIRNAEITECIVRDFFSLEFPYESVNDVMKIIKDEDLVQSEHAFGLQCSIKVGIRISMRENIVRRFKNIDKIKLQYIVRQ